jgi:hypothetical protein
MVKDAISGADGAGLVSQPVAMGRMHSLILVGENGMVIKNYFMAMALSYFLSGMVLWYQR